MREEELGERLGQTLKNIYIPDSVLAQLEKSLLADTGHQEQSQKPQRERLEKRLGLVRHKFEHAYMDELDGKISEEFWERKAVEWKAEEEQIQHALRGVVQVQPERILDGIKILELANKAYTLYVKQTPEEKAKLLRMVLSNCSVDAVSLYPTYRKPFDLIFERAKNKEWCAQGDDLRTFLGEIVDLVPCIQASSNIVGVCAKGGSCGGSAAESDSDLILRGLGNAARVNSDAVEPRSIEQDVRHFIQSERIHKVLGRHGVGNRMAFGNHGERHEAIFVFEADEEADEIGEICRVNAAVLEMFQHLVFDGVGILPDWGGHANHSFQSLGQVGGFAASSTGAKKKSYALGECVSRGEK